MSALDAATIAGGGRAAPEAPLTPGPELKATTRIECGWVRTVARQIDRRVAIVLLAQLAAFWPVWHDCARRVLIGIDEPWGLLALATAIGVVARGRATRHGDGPGLLDRRFLFLAALPVLAYALVAHRAPPLVGGLLATGALGLTLSRIATGRSFDAALAGLLLLSLPVSSALQFYLGFPMRGATAAVAAPLLRATGLAVTPAGTVLEFGGQSIWIDAPCSGVKMLWAGLFLALTLAAVYRLSNARTVAAAALALVAVFAGNVLRSAALFYLEAGIVRAPPWAHPAVGVVAFALTALAILWVVARLTALAPLLAVPLAGCVRVRDSARARSRPVAFAAYLSVCAIAAVPPLLVPRAATASADLAAFPGWPADFEGRALTPTPLTDRERHFLTDFPGRVAKFTDGRRQFVLRWTPAATRKLHLSSDCFRGAGFQVTPLPALSGRPAKDGAPDVEYSRFTATRGGETLTVSERIYDETGRSWPDVSSWYWAAVMGRTSGPWWAVTVVEGGSS